MRDRQITLTRLIAAPQAMVWAAWTNPDLLPNWFGPEGYSCKTKEIALHQGGIWRFDMIAPDGTIFANRHRYTLSDPPHRLHFLMDDDSDASAPNEVEVTLTAEGDATRLIMCITFPTAAARAEAENYGAEELGYTTLAKLAAMVER